MNKIKLLSFAVIGLLFLNIGIVCFLYLTRPNSNHDHDPRKPKDIIIEKLHFDANQIKKYESFITIYRKNNDSLNVSNKEIKTLLYSQLKQPIVNNKIKDSLIQLLTINQKRIEESNFKHFLDIKNLCRKSQIDDFNSLTEDLEKLFSNQNKKPRPEFRNSPQPDFEKNSKEKKSKTNFTPAPHPPREEYGPPPPPRDGELPRGPRGNRPPPPNWEEEGYGRPDDQNRPPPRY